MDRQDININLENLKPISPGVRTVLEDFLNYKSITDHELESLRSDSNYSFSALGELMSREGISFNEFIAFVHQDFPRTENEVFTFLEKNGVAVTITQAHKIEISLRELFEKEFDEKLSALLLFYIKVLLSNVVDDPDLNLNSPASETTSTLLAIVQSLKPRTNNVDQLRTLDLIENCVEKYSHELQNLQNTPGNTLTPQEHFNALPSMSDVNKVSAETTTSAGDAIWQLIDYGSRDRIPKYEYRIGKSPLPQRSQQKMDYLMDVLKSIDTKTNRTDYSHWMPGYFDTGGGIANKILAEATDVKILESFFDTSIKTGLEKYSTLDANKNLEDFLASSLARDIAKKRYTLSSSVKNFGELVAATFLAFQDDKRESGGEIISEKKVNDALEKGYVDERGNYISPEKVDPATREFMDKSVNTAARDGINESLLNVKDLDGNLSDAVGINPVGDFYPNSLGSTFFPDPEKGLANLPLEFSPSVASMVGDRLGENYSPAAMKSLQKNIFENPELFQNSRFSGDFEKMPSVSKMFADAGISNSPFIKNAINGAFAENNFDRVGDNIFGKLGKGGNEVLGNLSQRLGIPFDQDATTFSNLLPFLGKPFDAAAHRLGSAGVPFLPGNENFARELYGAQALAAKGGALPTDYPPEVLAGLMGNEANFREPVQQRPEFSPEQMEQYKKYQEAMHSGQYGKKRPKPSRTRNAAKQAQNAGEGARQKSKQTPLSGAVAGSMVGFLTASPAILQAGFAITGIPLYDFVSHAIFGGGKAGKWEELVNNLGILLGTNEFSREFDASGNFVLNNSNIFFRLRNNTVGRIPLIGRFLRSYSLSGRYSPLVAALMRRGIRTGDLSYMNAAQNADAFGKFLRIIANPTRLLSRRAPTTNQWLLRFASIRGNLATLNNSLLGLAAPLRKDTGMVGAFMFVMDTIPKSALGIAGIGKNILKGSFNLLPPSIKNRVMAFIPTSFLSNISSKWNILKNGYFFSIGKIGGFLNFAYDPSKYIQARLKILAFNLTRRLITFMSVRFFRLFRKFINTIFSVIRSAVAKSVASMLGVLSLGCVIIGVIVLLSLIAGSAIISANKTAYSPSYDSTVFGGVAVVASSTGGACGQGYKESTVTFKGKSYNARVLDVPYFNQVLLDKGDAATFASDTDKQSRVANDRIKGGGNMCGAASSTMVSGFFQGNQLVNNSSTVLQDYMYMNKNQKIDPTKYCNSSDSTGAQKANGAYYITSGQNNGGRCGGVEEGSSSGGMTNYLGLNGVQASASSLYPSVNSIYTAVQASIAKGYPLILSFYAPLGHIDVVKGYIYEGNDVKGIIVNDPYANLQTRIDSKSNLDYTSTGVNGGKDAIYDLNTAGFGPLFYLQISSAVCTASQTTSTDDVLINTIWKHHQISQFTSPFAALAAAMKSVNVDLGSVADQPGEEVIKIENRLISDAQLAKKVNTTAPILDSNNKISTWGNPNNEFVGNLNGVGVTDEGGIFANNVANAGYGTSASYLNSLAQSYTSIYGVNSKLLSSNTASNKDEAFAAVKVGKPVIVWVTTDFQNISGTRLNILQTNKSSGKYVWKDSVGNSVNYIPGSHAVVLYGYNDTKGSVYIMDPLKGAKGNGTDTAGVADAKTEISTTRFMQIWSLFDYQGLIISK